MSRDFCHLHVHTQYSILDGGIEMNALCNLIKNKFDMNSIAVTDHGVMSGMIELHKAAKKHDLKPIFGCELYITDDPDGIENNEDKNRDNYHLVAIAMNDEGYKNLLRIVSNAYLRNFYYKPRVTRQFLADHSDGLIVLSGCINGQCFKGGHYDPELQKFSDPKGDAAKIIQWYREVFGDRYYFEIQDNPDLPQQTAYNTWLTEQGKKLGIQSVITADAHYLTLADKPAHDILMAAQLKQTAAEYLDPENEFQFGPWNYVRSGEEMLQAAVKHGNSEAFENSLVISERCDVKLKLVGDGGDYLPPVYDIDASKDKDEFEEWLRRQNASKSQH